MHFGLLALLFLAVPATAGEISLSSPIDCDLNGPCYIQQYVDHDPSDGSSDFACTALTYDGHKGTDFALPTHAMIDDGINVIAAAHGTVMGVRDGMPDVRYAPDNATQSEGRECGNGVVLRHANGWETQYCHLRQGSITVTRGQQMKTGDVLGEVGMSGRAAFAHLHLSVRRDGAVIDPFDPDGSITCGTPDPVTLWTDPIPYRPGGIISIGTSAAVPEFDAIRAGAVPAATADGDALVIYAFLFGTQAGDTLSLTLNGPDGEVAARNITLDRTQAQSFRAIGKKLRSPRWPAGNYTGTATLLRAGTSVDAEEITLTLP